MTSLIAAPRQRRSRVLRGLVLALGLFATTGSPARAASGLVNGQDVAKAVTAVTQAVGGPVRAISVEVTHDQISITAQDAHNPRHIDLWQLNRRKLGPLEWQTISGPQPVAPELLNSDLEANLFDLASVDLGAIDAMMRAAIETAALDDPSKVTRMEISRQTFILPKPSSGDVRWTLHVDSGREFAEVYADVDGNITGADLSHTRRARELDILADLAKVVDAARAFRAEVGDGAVLTRVSVSAKSVGFGTNLPDKSLALLTSGSIKSHAVFTWNLEGLRRRLGSVDTDGFIAAPDAPFSVDDVDWSLAPKLVATARRELAMPTAAITNLEVTQPSDNVGAPMIVWTIELMDENGEKGTVVADVKGALRTVLLPETRRAAADWRDPAQMLQVLDRIEGEFGKDAAIFELDFEKDRVTITADDPRKPGEAMQVFLEHGGFQRWGRPFPTALGGRPFHIADLRRALDPARLRELEARTTTTLKLPSDSILAVTLGRGGFDPSPKGNITAEIRAEDHPFGRSGRIVYELDGTVIQSYLPDPPAGPKPTEDDDFAACRQQIDAGKALAACTRLLDGGTLSKSDQAGALTNRGLAHWMQHDYDAAVADHTRAIEFAPDYTNAYNNRGLAYRAKGDLDHAIADFSKAVAVAPDNGIAFANRGSAYLAKGDNDAAIRDETAALNIDPQTASAHSTRGRAFLAKGDFARAIAEFDKALELGPKSSYALYERGRAHFYAGDRAKAQADLADAAEIAPKYAYAALWLDIALRRDGRTARLAETSAQLDRAAWPAPVVQLFLGGKTAEDVLAAAENPDPATRKGRVCEANFYSGELALLAGKKDEAKHLFRLAADDCPLNFDEWDGARAELAALGDRP